MGSNESPFEAANRRLREARVRTTQAQRAHFFGGGPPEADRRREYLGAIRAEMQAEEDVARCYQEDAAARPPRQLR